MKKILAVLGLIAVATLGIVWIRIKTDKTNPNNYKGYEGHGYKTYDFEYEGQFYAFNAEDRSWVWITQVKQNEPNIVIPETVEFYGKEYPVKGLGWHMNYHGGQRIKFDTLTVPPGIEIATSFAMESAVLKKIIFTGKNEFQINDSDKFKYGHIDEIECLSEEPGNIRFSLGDIQRITVPKGCIDAYKEAYRWLPDGAEIVERE